MTYSENVSAYTHVMFICELPKRERLYWYRSIKTSLINSGVFNYESLKECMSEKIKDIHGCL